MNTLIEIKAHKDVLNLMLTCGPLPLHEDEIALHHQIEGGIAALEVVIDVIERGNTREV